MSAQSSPTSWPSGPTAAAAVLWACELARESNGLGPLPEHAATRCASPAQAKRIHVPPRGRSRRAGLERRPRRVGRPDHRLVGNRTVVHVRDLPSATRLDDVLGLIVHLPPGTMSGPAVSPNLAASAPARRRNTGRC